MHNEVIFHIEKTGLHTTVQDFGRNGYQVFGIPIGGVLDRKAAQIANLLVGNRPEAPVLEITLIGPQIRVEGNAQIALTGANLSPSVNGKFIEMYQTLHLENQDVLAFGKPQYGCRSYLAIGGEWKVRHWLGSQSASLSLPHLLTPDSIFQKNSILRIENPHFIIPQKLAPEFWGYFSLGSALKLLPAPEFEAFAREWIGYFFSQTFRIQANSNRMGYRLEDQTQRLQTSIPSMISSGLIAGTIQIPSSGHPILLLADTQTTGGYPRFAQVINADLDKIAQYKPADEISFQLVSQEEAKQAALSYVADIQKMKERLTPS